MFMRKALPLIIVSSTLIAPATAFAEETVDISLQEEKAYIAAIAGEQQELNDDYSWVTSDVLLAMDRDARLELLGQMATADERLTGIPASLTLAQLIIESTYGESGLSAKYENYFGIKASSGNYNWKNSTWDGRVADMATGEYYGYYADVTAGFRVYDNAWDSMRDHSAYLLGSTRGGETRYVGITEATGPEAAYILVEGGYATSPTYAETLISTMDKCNLYRFDQR